MTVGSNSNVAENGMEKEEDRAAIWEIDVATGSQRVFASGLRNPNGLAWEPASGALWTVVNERDELGSDLVPDYLTSVKDGALLRLAVQLLRRSTSTTRVKPQRPDLVAKAIAPDYALGSHVAPLGSAPSRRQRACPRSSPAACSSASTARGIASRAAATRWSSCRSATASRRASRSTC